jgi:predicted transcriptional regulator
MWVPRVVKSAPADPCENVNLASILRATGNGATASLIFQSVPEFGRSWVAEYFLFLERKRLMLYDAEAELFRLTKKGESFLATYDMLTEPLSPNLRTSPQQSR